MIEEKSETVNYNGHFFNISNVGGTFIGYGNNGNNKYKWLDKINYESKIFNFSSEKLITEIKKMIDMSDCKMVSRKNNIVENIEFLCMKEKKRLYDFINPSIQSIQENNVSKMHLHFKVSTKRECAEIIVIDYIDFYKRLLRKDKLFGTLDLINENIYVWKIKINKFVDSTNKFIDLNDLEIQLEFHPLMHPHYPPSVNIISPIFENNLNERISQSKYTSFSYWNCTRNIYDLIMRICNIVQKHGVIITQKNQYDNLSPTAQQTLNNIRCLINDFLKISDYNVNDIIDSDLVSIKRNTTTNKADSDKGVGYGHDGMKEWNQDEYQKLLAERFTNKNIILEKICSEISCKIYEEQTKIPVSLLINNIKKSHLYPYICDLLRNASLLEVTNNKTFYTNIFKFIEIFCSNNTIEFFHDNENNKSIYDSFKILHQKAENALSIDNTNDTAIQIDTMFKVIESLYEEFVKSSNKKKKNTQTEILQEINNDDFNKKYINYMKNYKSDIVLDLHKSANYYYFKRLDSESDIKLCYKRLSNEIPSLIETLPCNSNAFVMLRVDKKRPNCMRFLLNGPINTPYSLGLFIFDAYCKSEYPNLSPEFHFVNTGGNRFNPNLYSDGKVCLSLLGTYSGPTPQKSEKWIPKISTLSQVIISIQAQILVDEPYYNEPSYEDRRGNKNYEKDCIKYTENVRQYTMKSAMLELLTNINAYPEFKKPILMHFYLQKTNIIEQCKTWISECTTPITKDVMKQILERLIIELNKLKLDGDDVIMNIQE